MAVMPPSLYPVRLISSLLFLLFLLIPFGSSSQVILNLHYSQAGETIDMSWSNDPISRRENVISKVLSNPGIPLTIQLDIPFCTALRLRYRNLSQTLLVQPGKDTLSLIFNQTLNAWQASDAAVDFQNEIQAIDLFADRTMLGMGRPGTPGAVRKASVAADSLRKRYTAAENDFCLGAYAHFTAAFLELSSGKQASAEYIENVFSRNWNALHNPAFAAVFHYLFDGMLFQSGQGNLLDNWQRIQHGDHLAQSFRQWIRENRGIGNDTLINWIILNSVHELLYRGGIRKDELLALLNSADPDFQDPLMIELSAYLKAKIHFTTRGLVLPDFSFSDARSGTLMNLDMLKGKPVYLVYLPSDESDLLQNLFYLNGFQKKYGKEFHFLALVNHTSSKMLADLALKHNFSFLLSSFDASNGFKLEVLESISSPGFVLIDRNGQIWQNPAESPETNVESAFLTLIKQ
jgi:hypothetical protein